MPTKKNRGNMVPGARGNNKGPYTRERMAREAKRRYDKMPPYKKQEALDLASRQYNKAETERKRVASERAVEQGEKDFRKRHGIKKKSKLKSDGGYKQLNHLYREKAKRGFKKSKKQRMEEFYFY